MTANEYTIRKNLESATNSINILLAFSTQIQNQIYTIKNTLESKQNHGEIVTTDEASLLIARLDRYNRELAKAGSETLVSFAESINAEAAAYATANA